MANFYAAWEDWFVYHQKQDAELERHLASRYREAWATGDTEDQYAALNFIFDRRDSGGFDLVAEGVRSNDESIASNAVAFALCLIREGSDLDLTRADFERFHERFPNWDGLSTGAIEALASRGAP